jgi:hypothetical protein
MEIPKRIFWDGGNKYLTKDCETCEYYRQINGQEICGWARAFKYLKPRHNPRKCEVKDREKNNWHSIIYLDKIIPKIQKNHEI